MPALLIIGVVIILGGGVLFAVWFEYLWQLVKALLPLALIGVGGVIAYFGWEEKKDRKGAFLDFSSPTEASRYQAEALAYQEKINGFSEEAGPSDPIAYDGGPQAETPPSAPVPEPMTRIEIKDSAALKAEEQALEAKAEVPGAAGSETAEAGPPEPEPAEAAEPETAEAEETGIEVDAEETEVEFRAEEPETA
ncbi:MAG: hypothetical protein LBT40_12430 [Deltaproteobacteria bacterium]|jgi:hypothetical protein|nr:hypothetical protein [Deltaproteobacteria bacterium]